MPQQNDTCLRSLSDMHRTFATAKVMELCKNKNTPGSVNERRTSDCPRACKKQQGAFPRRSCIKKHTMLVLFCLFVLLAFGECQNRRRVNFCGRQLVEKLLKHCYPRGIHGSTRHILESKYGSRQRYTRSLVRQCCREICTPEKLERYCERSPRENRFTSGIRRKLRLTTVETSSTFSTQPTVTSPIAMTTLRTTTSLHFIRAIYQEDINEASAVLYPALADKVAPVKLNVSVKDPRRLVPIPGENFPGPELRKGSREASGSQHDSGYLQARLISERDAAGYARDKYA